MKPCVFFVCKPDAAVRGRPDSTFPNKAFLVLPIGKVVSRHRNEGIEI